MQVNVLKGMKLYEEVFTGSQISKLTSFVNELRLAGQRGQLSGIYFYGNISSIMTTIGLLRWAVLDVYVKLARL